MRVLLLTDYRKALRQGIKKYRSIDINKIKKIFFENQMDLEIMNYDKLVNEIGIENIKNKFIIYTSSQNNEYKEYINDILYNLNLNNTLIPKYELFKCHENKAFQDLHKKMLGIKSLDSLYISTYKDLLNHTRKVKYPVVLKKVTGSGSISVYKVHNEHELKKMFKKIATKKYLIEFYKKYIYYKFFDKISYSKEFLLEEKYYSRLVIQQFIPNLEDDWKILVFNNKFYSLNRKVRKNDFRASGSGQFNFLAEPPKRLLDFAKKIYSQLDTPFISLDIAINDEDCYLIEYQALHFGPITLLHSEFYFTYVDEHWEKVEEQSDFTSVYAQSLIEYINNQKSNNRKE